jgi:hypothetical protein
VSILLKRATSDSQRFLQAQDNPTSEMQSGHNARPQDLHTAIASELRWVKHFMMLTGISHWLVAHTSRGCVPHFSSDYIDMQVVFDGTYYNFCRLHFSLPVTPAMEAGVADHVWSLEEIILLLD